MQHWSNHQERCLTMYNKLGAWTTIDDNTVPRGSENALKCEDQSRLLGDQIRNEEAILHGTGLTSEKILHFLPYRQSRILQDVYFLYRIRRFVSELI